MKAVIETIVAIMRPTRSSIDALRKILSRNEFKSLLLTSPDRRECLENAASIARISVESLLQKVATLLDVSALLQIQTDSDGIRGRFKNPSSLYQAACIPLMKDSILVGFACVDPALVKMTFAEFKDLQLFLSPWSSIRAALDRIDWKLPAETCEANHQLSPTVATQILVSIYEEAKRFGESKAQIRFEPEFEFLIPLTDGRIARGSVRSEAKPVLAKCLKENSLIDIDTAKVSITSSHDKTSYLLDFDYPERSSQMPVELPVPLEFGGTDSTVLLVDDNETFARVLDRYLAKIDVTAHHAPHGAKALEILDGMTDPPSLIICDIHMPVMNGFEFVRRLKADDRYKLVPVIMLTSDTDVEAQIALLSCGVDAFVSKQEDPRVLCMHAKRLLSREPLRRAA